MRCVICARRVRSRKKIGVIEQGVKTAQGLEREMEVDTLEIAHRGCYDMAVARYQRKAAKRSADVPARREASQHNGARSDGRGSAGRAAAEPVPVSWVQ